jgi:hypothetical protein
VGHGMIKVIYELDRRADGVFTFHCPYCSTLLYGLKFAPTRCKSCECMLPFVDDLAVKLGDRLHYYEFGMRKGVYLG